MRNEIQFTHTNAKLLKPRKSLIINLHFNQNWTNSNNKNKTLTSKWTVSRDYCICNLMKLRFKMLPPNQFFYKQPRTRRTDSQVTACDTVKRLADKWQGVCAEMCLQ